AVFQSVIAGGHLITGRVEQPQVTGEGRAAVGRRGQDRQHLAGHGAQAVQVHVPGEIQAVADPGGVTVTAVGRPRPGGRGGGQGVPCRVGRRRDQAQVEVVVAGVGERVAAVGDVGVVVGVVQPRHTDVIGAGGGELVFDGRVGAVVAGVNGQLVA